MWQPPPINWSGVGDVSKTRLHVHPNEHDEWCVRWYGHPRAIRNFSKKAEAVRFARPIARKERTALTIHKANGVVQAVVQHLRPAISFEPSPDFGKGLCDGTLHVHTNMDGGWSVRWHGSRRSIRKFSTKKEAIRLARKIARKWKTEFAIHGHDASVESVVSYEKKDVPSKKASGYRARRASGR